jgi:hypothetical protein
LDTQGQAWENSTDSNNTLVLIDGSLRVELNSDISSKQFGVVKSLKKRFVESEANDAYISPSLVDPSCNSTNWHIEVLVENHTNVFYYDNNDGVVNRTILGTPSETEL